MYDRMLPSSSASAFPPHDLDSYILFPPAVLLFPLLRVSIPHPDETLEYWHVVLPVSVGVGKVESLSGVCLLSRRVDLSNAEWAPKGRSGAMRCLVLSMAPNPRELAPLYRLSNR